MPPIKSFSAKIEIAKYIGPVRTQPMQHVELCPDHLFGWRHEEPHAVDFNFSPAPEPGQVDIGAMISHGPDDLNDGFPVRRTVGPVAVVWELVVDVLEAERFNQILKLLMVFGKGVQIH